MTMVTAQSNNLQISNITAREILDSRGVPTLECAVSLNNGIVTVSSISTNNSGKVNDFVELRDGDTNRFMGMGTTKAAAIINDRLTPMLIGKNPTKQEELDRALLSMDHSKNLSTIGSNSTMVVSQAIMKAAALSYGWPTYYYLLKKYQLASAIVVPTCMYGLIDGGKHGTDNLDFQEYQIIPANHFNFHRSLEIAVQVYRTLGMILKEKGAISSVGPSGGYTPNLYKNTDAFDLIAEAAKACNLTIGHELFFGADFDASSFYKNGRYHIKDNPEPLSDKAWQTYLQDLNKIYGLYAFEDPFATEDLNSWKEFVGEFDKTTRVIADSPTRSNAKLIDQARDQKICNTVIIKTSQAPTCTYLVEAVMKAREFNWQVVLSNREGETNDDFLADLGVGLGVDFLKFGPPNRGERVAKYNRLKQIAFELEKLQAN